MPQYYLHIQHPAGLAEDPEGLVLPSLDAARAEAIAGIRDILAEAIKRGVDDWLDDAIVIVDETGQELMSIPFADALPPRLQRV